MNTRVVALAFLFLNTACASAPASRERLPTSQDTLPVARVNTLQRPFAHPMAITKNGMVVTCQPLAAQIGVDILRKGGSAADAFIAATLGEYVTAFGYTSLSGPLYVLYYDAKNKTTHYLNAGNNKVLDPAGQFNPAHPVAGESFVVGGAGPGLDELHQKFGRLSLSEDAKPAVDLAQSGFPISAIYAWSINDRRPMFQSAAAWNSLYIPDGAPLAAGAKLVQNELAHTLTQFGEQGSSYLMKGRYAHNLVKTIQAAGGKLTLNDLSNYKVYWSQPLTAKYRDFEVQTASYRSGGGPLLLYALKTIEHDKHLTKAHFTDNESTFTTVLRTYLFSLYQSAATWNKFAQRLDTIPQQTAMLNGPRPATTWSAVSDLSQSAPWANSPGTHSCATLVIDREGNMVSDIHTINSYAWGDYGLINDGVSLNSAYVSNGDAPPGERTIDPLAPIFIFHNGHPVAAASFFDGGLKASAFQVALNLMDYDMNPSDAILKPRFGSVTGFNPLTLPLDPRFFSAWVNDFAKMGIVFQQPKNSSGAVDMHGYVDTGDAMVIRLDEKTGLRYGMPTEVLQEATAQAE